MKIRNERRGEKGVVLALFVFAIVSILLAIGLAIDLGVAYVASSAMSKSVDAGVLAGARYSDGTIPEIEALAVQIAEANFPDNFIPVAYTATASVPSTDTIKVRVEANSHSPALFSRLIGKTSLTVNSAAEAVRYPLDMSFVLDVSGSLVFASVFDDMQAAATSFLTQFNDNLDQVGLISYSTVATEHHVPAKAFKATLTTTIAGLSGGGYTNIDEALEMGKGQLDNAPNRSNAVKVLVLFTDGRPTAFSDELYMNLTAPKPEYYDGVMVTGNSGSGTGLFQQGTGLKIRYFSASTGNPVTTSNNYYSSYDKPQYLPGNLSVNGDNVRAIGISQAEAWANTIRAAGYTIYVIGLGNPNGSADLQPDLDFLERVANHGGIVSSSQPKGAMIFAPSAVQLEAAFDAVADRILTRLTE